jgi:hypothetical protein
LEWLLLVLLLLVRLLLVGLLLGWVQLHCVLCRPHAQSHSAMLGGEVLLGWGGLITSHQHCITQTQKGSNVCSGHNIIIGRPQPQKGYWADQKRSPTRPCQPFTTPASVRSRTQLTCARQ